MGWKQVLAALALWSATAPIAKAADVALTPAQVSSDILGKDVSHGERHHIIYSADGTLSVAGGLLGMMGTYRVEKDGRICWRMGPPTDAGCFQYYRRDAQLRVRRTDSGSAGDIGPVTVTPFKR